MPAGTAVSGPGVVAQPPQYATSRPLPSTNIYEGIAFVEEIVGATGQAPTPNVPPPLIVALHGLGDVPEHFIQVLRALPLRARVAAARAPTPFAQGYAWLPPAARATSTSARNR